MVFYYFWIICPIKGKYQVDNPGLTLQLPYSCPKAVLGGFIIFPFLMEITALQSLYWPHVLAMLICLCPAPHEVVLYFYIICIIYVITSKMLQNTQVMVQCNILNKYFDLHV